MKSNTGIGRAFALFVLGVGWLAPGGFAAPSQTKFAIRNGDRVVFYGDSITDSQWYPTLVETYVLTRYPAWRNHFSNRGSSGDSSRSILRFQRDVLDQNADVCTYNMGFNDGGYGTLKSASIENYLANVEDTVKLARKVNPKLRLILASPIVNEVTVSKDTRWVSHESYPYTMLMFGEEEANLARRLSAPFIDTGLQYARTLGLGQVVAGDTFKLSRDGVHPERAGQAFIAFYLLQGMGADPLVASVTIDAARARVASVRRCKVNDLSMTGGVLSFRRKCECLPYPIPPEARPFAFLARINDNLSADILTVTGLPAKAYTLSVDNHDVGDVASSNLEQGINLSRFTDTPMYQQAMAVMNAVWAKQGADTAFWRQYIVTGKADGAGKPTDKATPDDRIAMAAAQKAIADDEAAAYALNTPAEHTIRLTPTQAVVGRYDDLVNNELNGASLNVSISPVSVDWNAMKVTRHEVALKIDNPGPETRSGTLSWCMGNGWSVTPAEATFVVDPEKSQTLTFSVDCTAAIVPPPSVTLQWKWSNDWPYPMTLTRQLELKPTLVIARSIIKPTLSGNLNDWKDATTFILDTPYFIDPATPGKKLLWGGPSDLSGQIYVKWDDDALYVAVLARDSDHIQNADESMMWSQDSLMLALHVTQPGKGENSYEFGFGAYSDHDAIVRYRDPATNAIGPDIQFKSKVDKKNGTCLYETAIPWNRLPPLMPSAGREIGFTFALGDADSQLGKGFNYLEWTPGIHFGKNPADFATLVLGEK